MIVGRLLNVLSSTRALDYHPHFKGRADANKRILTLLAYDPQCYEMLFWRWRGTVYPLILSFTHITCNIAGLYFLYLQRAIISWHVKSQDWVRFILFIHSDDKIPAFDGPLGPCDEAKHLYFLEHGTPHTRVVTDVNVMEFGVSWVKTWLWKKKR